MKIMTDGSKDSENHLQITLQQDNESIVAIDHTHNKTYRLPKTADLVLQARGQDGNNGRIGRDGQNGVAGIAGRDATREWEATPGHDGGDGRPGEPGSNGTDGGNGGCIELSIDPEDLALLPFIKDVDVSPGKAGMVGKHGRGGAGGKGGRGGEGIWWTTTESYSDVEIYQPPPEKRPIQRRDHRHQHRHDHNHSTHEHGHSGPPHDHRHSEAVVESSTDLEYEWYTPPPIERPVKKTRIRSHERPKAADGRSGRPGVTPNYPLLAGKKGVMGSYYIHISNRKSGQQPSTHTSTYQLSIEPTADTPQMIEPGEAAVLSYKISNHGKTMISPVEAMPLTFQPSDFFSCDQTLMAAGSIEPNQFRIVYQPIQLKSIEKNAHEYPYKEQVYVAVDLMNTRLNRAYAKAVHSFTSCYPVQLACRQQELQINNIASKAMGAAADRKILIDILNDKHQPIDSFSIDAIAANAAYTKPLQTINFGAAAWYLNPKKHFIDLYLQPINNRDELVLIQELPLAISSLFKLKLTRDASSDPAIYEPGEKISLSYGARNTSDTHFSPDELLNIDVEAGYFIQSSTAATMKGKIKPTQSTTSEQPASITLKTIANAETQPFIQKVTLTAHLRGGTGEYDQYSHPIELRYPLTLDLPTRYFVTPPGKTAPLLIDIKNVSARSVTGREIRLKITDQQQTLLAEHSLGTIPANKSITVTSDRCITSSAEKIFVEPATYYVDLYLQPIDQTQSLTLIQRQTVKNKVLIDYQSAGHFTLVVNDAVSAEEKKDWYAFIQELSGKYPAFYDASYYKANPISYNLEKLLADNPYGSVCLLTDTWLDNAINPKFLWETDQSSHATLMKVGSLHASSRRPYQLQVPEDGQPVRAVTSSAALIKELLRPPNAPNEKLIYKIEKSIGCLHSDQYCLSRLQRTLDETFPNRKYQVISQRLDESKINLYVQRVSDPDVGKVGQLSSRKLTPEVKEAVIDNLPFMQKMNFFVRKTSQYREKLITSMQQDLFEEQTRLRRTRVFGSFWERRRDKYDQSQLDMRHLRSLVEQLKYYHGQGDFHSVNVWAPLIKDLIQEVKKYVQENIDIFDKVLHFFSPQGKVMCARGAVALCNEGLSILAENNAPKVAQGERPLLVS
ncbi:MAG: collagen-like protein [Legionella sp.]|nr:collagen-like protein [Legionella sp.]